MPETAPPTAVSHLKLLNCARGHHWESALAADGTARETTCPTCGAPAELSPILDLDATEVVPLPPAQTPLPPPYQEKGGKPVVPGYEVLEDLGRTTAGVAQYRAKQIAANRLVILKTVLAREDASQQAWGSLRGEAAALGKLPHPNIVGIFDCGDRDRQLFFNAIELVEGPHLGTLVAGKPLPVKQAIALVEVLARAVHFAHEKGVVHRGLRPQTVLIQVLRTDKKSHETPEPPACTVHAVLCIPKLTGYGLAKARLVEGDVTDQEMQDKFPCYLSPEQTWGRSKEIGPATDVYALGAILYECLTGAPPFKGSSPATTLEQIQSIDPLPIARVRKEPVPADVEAIVRKCLHKQPRRRYASARGLADDLRRAAEGRPTKARDANFFVRSAQWSRRNPMAFATLGAVLLGLIGVLWTVAVGNRRVREELGAKYSVERDRDRIKEEWEIVKVQAASSRRRADQADYFQQIARADALVARNQKVLARRILDTVPESLRHIEWYLVRQMTDVDDKTSGILAPPLSHPVTSLSWKPDGQSLAASAGADPNDFNAGPSRGEVRVWSLTGQNAELRRMPGARLRYPVGRIAFHPTEDWVAWMTDTGFTLWDLRNSASLSTATAIWNQQPAYFNFTPDGRSVLMSTTNGQIGRHEVRSNQMPVQVAGLVGQVLHSRIVPLTPDGTRFVESRDSGMVSLYDVNNFNSNLAVLLADVTDLAYHAESKRLAIGAADGTISFWELSSPNTSPSAVLSGHTKSVASISFSPDGKRLASCGADGSLRIWDVESKREVLWMSIGSGRPPVAVAFSPKGHRLAYARDKTVWVLGE